MNKPKLRLLIFLTTIILLIIGVFVVAKNFRNIVKEDDGQINVLVTILPQKEFVESVGGDYVNVTSLVPPGSEPATYELTAQNLISIEKSDIYFRIGYVAFEQANIERIRDINSEMKVIMPSDEIKLRYFDEERDSIDPHFWLSPQSAIIMVKQIELELSAIMPEQSDYFKQNSSEYINKLENLDSELSEALSSLKQTKLFVFHPAWGYLADRYGLEQVALEHEGKESTTSHLQELVELAETENIEVVFIQEQFSSELAQSFAQDIGGVVVRVDPLSEDYLDNLRSVVNKIKEYLEK